MPLVKWWGLWQSIAWPWGDSVENKQSSQKGLLQVTSLEYPSTSLEYNSFLKASILTEG